MGENAQCMFLFDCVLHPFDNCPLSFGTHLLRALESDEGHLEIM